MMKNCTLSGLLFYVSVIKSNVKQENNSISMYICIENTMRCSNNLFYDITNAGNNVNRNTILYNFVKPVNKSVFSFICNNY